VSKIQTFLPYADYEKSAESLDNKRLGKQRVETYQILRVLAGITNGWQSHPAVKMWRGHEHALIDYGQAICREWINRGFNDTCLLKITEMRESFSACVADSPPEWVNDERVHLSHQSNLIRKFPEYYQSQFVGVPDDMDYYWPI
jgi:hypothetical protein